ncbi:hypothetical protein [Deinococcus koreensis]|uniref:Uncharacterized protein n=1 Tax=Deinococcus koreensis TaxID=2054903 RepID=A0A2K3USU9_9DEIO|nr:hypothetical protein [Deinococcus koreensis]PNY79612.1 hypothetical protein CVO96_16720 [Deinococcus koreensis]
MIVAFVNPMSTLVNTEPTPESERLASGLSLFLGSAELIPVTGMDESELLSVPAAFTSWQILQHGAVILTPDGEEDVAWRRLIMETQALRQQGLELTHQAALHITQLGQLGLDVVLVERYGRPLLVQLRHPHGLDLALEQAEQALREWLTDGPFQSDLQARRQGDTLSVLPRELTPASAVNYVIGYLGDETDLILGVSAQSSDADFLALCDYALVPGASPWATRVPDEDEDE